MIISLLMMPGVGQGFDGAYCWLLPCMLCTNRRCHGFASHVSHRFTVPKDMSFSGRSAGEPTARPSCAADKAAMQHPGSHSISKHSRTHALSVGRAQDAEAARVRAAAAASEVSDAERAAHAAAEEAHRVATLQAAADIKAWDEVRAAQQVQLPAGLALAAHEQSNRGQSMCLDHFSRCSLEVQAYVRDILTFSIITTSMTWQKAWQNCAALRAQFIGVVASWLSPIAMILAAA